MAAGEPSWAQPLSKLEVVSEATIEPHGRQAFVVRRMNEADLKIALGWTAAEA
jgi:hypothetical protein